MIRPQKKFMLKAIELARKSAQKGDYAVAAVIARKGRIISTGMTLLKQKHDPTAHAEMVAIRNACRKLKSFYLEGCILYSTHEPCPMCAAAAVWAKMEGIVFGATINDARDRSKGKFSWRQIQIRCKEVAAKGDPKLEIVEGFMRKDCLPLFKLSR